MATVNMIPLLCVNTATVGGATHTGVPGSSTTQMAVQLGDNNNATYVNQSVNPTFAGGSQYSLTPITTIPTDARVASIAWVRSTQVTTGSRSMQTFLNIGTPSAPTTRTVQGLDYVTDPATGAVTVTTGPSIDRTSDGFLLTADVLNNILLDIRNGGSSAGTAWWLEAKLQVVYDTIPVTSVVNMNGFTSGTISLSGQPSIGWTYTDDLQPQSGYQVQILDNTGAVFEDSGNVSSSNNYYQVTRSLTPGATYTVKVRTRQLWTGPGGDFWSAYATSGSFTIVNIPAPDVQVTSDPSPSLGANLVSIQPNINLLSYEDSSFEGPALTSAGFLGWGAPSGTNRSGITSLALNTNATYVNEGQKSMTVTFSASSAFVRLRSLAAVTVDQRYVFSIKHKVDAATTLGSLAIVAEIRWYNANGSTVGSLVTGTAALANKTNWITSEVFAVAPATAAYAQVGFNTNSTSASGQVVYFDNAIFMKIDSGDSSYASISRGGLLQTKNLIAEKDANMNGTSTTWTGNTDTSVAISTTQTRSGTASLRLTKLATGANQVATLGQTLIPVTGAGTYTEFFCSYYLASGTGIVLSIAWKDSTGATVATQSTPSTGTPAATWADIHVNVNSPAIPATAIYGVLTITVTSVANGQMNYFDSISVVQNTNNSTTPFIGPVTGYLNLDGPYVITEAIDVPAITTGRTQAEWAALSVSNPSAYAAEALKVTNRFTEATNGYASWQTINKSLITADSVPTTTVYDRSAKTGTARFYRSYIYSVADGITIKSSENYKTYNSALLVGPSTLTFAESVLWLSAIDTRNDTVTNLPLADGYDAYAFRGIMTGIGENFENVSTDVVVSGRQYPVVQFGEQYSQEFSFQVALVTAADEAAFRTLMKRKCVLIARDSAGKRVKGPMRGISFGHNIWGPMVSFTIKATGTVYE